MLTYDAILPDYGDIMTVKAFVDSCNDNSFIDYDGFGHPVKDGKMCPRLIIKPSRRQEIPKEATHIVWFLSPTWISSKVIRSPLFAGFYLNNKIWEKGSTAQAKPKKSNCTCDILILMQSGCRCGSFVPNSN